MLEIFAADRMTWLSRLLSLTGLAISTYLAYAYLQHQAPVCSASAGCAIVAHSKYARPFGIPLPLLGGAGYLLLFIAACRRGQRALRAVRDRRNLLLVRRIRCMRGAARRRELGAVGTGRYRCRPVGSGPLTYREVRHHAMG
jgi:uncharacterized membrane protein